MDNNVFTNMVKRLLSFYYQAIGNVPILKYSRVIIVTILILAIAGYFKLKNSDVFLSAIVVILISFLAFLFSFLLKTKDLFIRRTLYLLISAIIVTMSAFILGFGFFIFSQKPTFYKRWFPDHSQTATMTVNNKNLNDTNANSDKIDSNTKSNFKNRPTAKTKIISIQLSNETGGYNLIYLDGNRIDPLPESTTFNPRLEINNEDKGELKITTKNGDTCITYLPEKINSDIIRIVPNCK
jgi:hypothetical protein